MLLPELPVTIACLAQQEEKFPQAQRIFMIKHYFVTTFIKNFKAFIDTSRNVPERNQTTIHYLGSK